MKTTEEKTKHKLETLEEISKLVEFAKFYLKDRGVYSEEYKCTVANIRANSKFL